MSNQRPKWFPVYGDPVRCPIRPAGKNICLLFDCVTNAGYCEERNALALVPKEEPMQPHPEITEV